MGVVERKVVMARSLPLHPSLVQLRKQAKEILRAHGRGDAGACPVLRQIPRFASASDAEILAAGVRLGDAQFALAREYGFAGWNQLKHHVDGTTGHAGDLIGAGALAGLIGRDVKEICTLREGGESAMLDVLGTSGRFIVRVAQSVAGAARIERERRVGEFLLSLGVAAPRITVCKTHGVVFGVYARIEGEPFINVRLSEDDGVAFVADMAGLLDRLHAVPLEEACRALGMATVTAQKAAEESAFGEWFDAAAIELALAQELAGDAALKAIWDQTRAWFASYKSVPANMVFGHGDLHGGNVVMARTSAGYRLAAVIDLQLGGILDLYSEFLRLKLLHAELGLRIVEAYNRMPGRVRLVDPVPLGHAFRGFGFYLAHERSGDGRRHCLAMVKSDCESAGS
jgi:aminoglycoside phosphotransferase (APT) family kinase protein